MAVIKKLILEKWFGRDEERQSKEEAVLRRLEVELLQDVVRAKARIKNPRPGQKRRTRNPDRADGIPTSPRSTS